MEWSKIVEIRTRNAFELMTTQALENEVDRIRTLLPPVPGRKWLVTQAAEAMATVVLAALEQGSTPGRLDELTVPAEIVHRGLLGRQRVLRGGLFAAATLVIVEPVADSLAATAALHGVPVRPAAAPAESDERARLEALRERTDAVARHLDQLRPPEEQREMQPEIPEQSSGAVQLMKADSTEAQ
ncbi:hypothetical protein ABIA32_000638 [Streptacidiphilus sp. MAP12-20]|uniref:hypothetical protein n=1 Tax=Streptacidiphilus sp. MAP12-20 TaxID=3156299 RepID=UPI003514BB59